ncbi:MAG: hypothetical protein H0V17_27905 [Deltaproteobacteria bacterium]|nr:hypothetical protein [Deltaproteobacteria bacterium]
MRQPLFIDPPRPDLELIALWIFALLGDSEDLLLQYLDSWPANYRAVAQA